MAQNTLNATLSDADKQAIKAAFQTILDKLPFLVNLTNEERKTIFKTGQDRVSFVQNALSAAHSNPNIFPPTFKTADFQKDVDLFNSLTEMLTLAQSVESQIDDTRLTAGGDAMRQATQVYNYVKEAAKTIPGLKPIAEQLGEQFKKASKRKQSGTPTPESAPPKS